MSNFLLCITLVLSLLVFQTNGLYFYLSKGMKKCFKDDVIKYSEIEAYVKLLDQEPLDFILSVQESIEQPEGILLELFQPDGSMNGQYVKHNTRYVFNTTQNGEHKICVTISDGVYDAMGENQKQLRVEVNYQNEYRKRAAENDAKKKEQKKAAKANAFEEQPQEPKNNQPREDEVQDWHFNPLRKRAERIRDWADDIIAHQQYGREKEQIYNQNLEGFNSSFKLLIFIQICVVIGAGVFSVISLRKFFVKKHIY